VTKRNPVVGATTEQIEQALAFGHRPEFVAALLWVPRARVLEVQARLDAINAEPDTVPAADGTYGRGA